MPTIRQVAALGCYIVASTLLVVTLRVGPDPGGGDVVQQQQRLFEKYQTTKELARRRNARHGLRGPGPRGPERLLHRQPGLELLRERGHDPPRARRGADEHEPSSDGFSPSRLL